MRLPLTRGNGPGGLDAVVAHVPVAARVEREPAVAVRHVGPLLQRGFDDRRPSARFCALPQADRRSQPMHPLAAGSCTWPGQRAGRESRRGRRARGCHSVTLAPTSPAAAAPAPARTGRCSAFSTSAGMRIACRCGLAERARPVVVGVAEAVQRRGEDVVELVQVARREQALAVEQARDAAPAWPAPWLHRAQEHARVDLPVEAAADGVGRRRPGRAASEIAATAAAVDAAALAGLLGPAQQRIAAERDADGEQRRRACARAGAASIQPISS